MLPLSKRKVGLELFDVPLGVQGQLMETRKSLLQTLLQFYKLLCLASKPDCTTLAVLKVVDFVQSDLQAIWNYNDIRLHRQQVSLSLRALIFSSFGSQCFL